MIASWEQALGQPVRANPAYRLLLAEDLPPGFLEAVIDLEARAVGVLAADPRSGLPDKVVDLAAAQLFSRFAGPAPFPVGSGGEDAGQLAQLVLDGVLEIDSGNGFISGPVALEMFAVPDEQPPPEGRLARLSHDAIAHAERLALSDADLVTARLYCFHRVPLSPRWVQELPGPEVVRRLLAGTASWTKIMQHWADLSSIDPGGDWLHFGRHGGEPLLRSWQLPYKLYVSPHVEAMAEAFPAAVDVLTRLRAPRFKVGSDAIGLLRPDKLVVYLPTADTLGALTEALNVELAGVPPHGVPFSAELAGEGLLSWGGDPRREEAPVGSDPESWRLSVCRRLAQYLVAAQRSRLQRLTPGGYALARLSLDGIDVTRFAPNGLEPPDLRQPVAVL